MARRVAAAPSGLTFEYVEIGPEQAQALLDTRQSNIRSIRQPKRDKFADEMAAGLWLTNGDMIRCTGPSLKDPGELLDGAHRMSAIVKSGVTLSLWFAFNVPTDVMPTIDTGAARTYGDLLRLQGLPNASAQASVTRRVALWNRGQRISRKGYASHTELEELRRKHDNEIRFATSIGMDIRDHTRFCTITSGGLFFFLAALVDFDQALLFKDRLVKGHGLTENNPVAVLRERLISFNAQYLQDYERLVLIINAWNLWRQDIEIQKIYLVYTPDNKGSSRPLTNENFPVPQ